MPWLDHEIASGLAPETHTRSVEVKNRWRNGRTGVSAAWSKNVVPDTVKFIRPEAGAFHLGQGSSPVTGYVDADQHAV
jgi:hypothetical protein